MGSGIVKTPGDFGARGEPPTHPELLDALAAGFMNENWSTKRLIRQIMASQAYQRSALPPEGESGDPENRLYAYQNQKRLDFETMRDSLLFISGLLDDSAGGPASGELIDSKFRRRGIYGRIDRLNLPEQLRTFDFPDPNTAAVDRSTTTTPAQSLFLMNHPLLQACAEGLLVRAEKLSPGQPAEQARVMARLAWQRELAPDEFTEIRQFLGEPRTRSPTQTHDIPGAAFSDIQ